MDKPPPSFLNFLAAFREHWFDAMSGGASVPFAALAAFSGQAYQQLIFGGMAFICTWFAAYRVWSRQYQRAEALSERLTPKLSIFFDADKRGIVDAIEQIRVLIHTGAYDGSAAYKTHDQKAKYLRLSVAAGTDTPVKGCEAYLVALEKRRVVGEGFVHIEVPQAISLRDTSFTAKPRITEFVDFVKATEENKLLPVCVWPNTLVDVFSDPGTYRFTFKIHGEDAAPDPVVVDVEWQGVWDRVAAYQVL